MCVSANVNMSESSADSLFKGTVSRDLEKAVIFYLVCVCVCASDKVWEPSAVKNSFAVL